MLGYLSLNHRPNCSLTSRYSALFFAVVNLLTMATGDTVWTESNSNMDLAYLGVCFGLLSFSVTFDVFFVVVLKLC